MVSHRSWLLLNIVACLSWVSGFDRNHPHRPHMWECKSFECKAGKRPIQKQEDFFKVFALDHCHTQKSEWDPAHGMKYGEALGICCYLKDVCVGSCGVSYETCYKKYWKCVDGQCDQAIADAGKDQTSEYSSLKSQCEEFGKHNDLEQIWHDRKVSKKAFVGGRDTEKVACGHFTKVQREACDCIPSSEYDRSVKKRAEDFFRKHEPEMLNKKGEIKDKKLWSRFKGKRPEMFFEMMMSYNESLELITNPGDDPAEKPAIAESDGVDDPDLASVSSKPSRGEEM